MLVSLLASLKEETVRPTVVMKPYKDFSFTFSIKLLFVVRVDVFLSPEKKYKPSEKIMSVLIFTLNCPQLEVSRSSLVIKTYGRFEQRKYIWFQWPP